MGVTLALRALGLGDLLTAVPALRALRAARGDDHLVLAAPRWLAPMVELADCADEILPTAGLGALRWDRPPPDLAVNLHGSGPQSIGDLTSIRPRRLLTYCHPDFPDVAGPAWPEQVHEVHRWCRLLDSADIPSDPTHLDIRKPSIDAPAGRVVVHPGGSAQARRWPPERFAAVAAHLQGLGYRIAVTGNAEEIALAAQVADGAGVPRRSVLAGDLTLTELAAVVANAALVISGDTGIGHLASAFATPSVVIFGPTPPAWWGPPPTANHIALWAGHIGDPHAAVPDPGLLRIGAGQVIAAAIRQLRCFGSDSGGIAPSFQSRTDSTERGETMSQKVNPIQVQKYLSGVDYPCDRRDIVRAARSNGAGAEIVDALESMPDRMFDGPNAVSEAMS
ncbi:glycosyltransferase family 9 protein [Nocardia mikamii]|uniref:glycosyltransferase family 9 protein n=1 Tax=Nocardia mikamii TaxID=508464 RepID=UPI0007C7776E|nr:glycosyltransferase family 9 protein [Nocardia mikamii]